MTKTFLLGAGCQKGGTTWLYQYLTGSPQFAQGYRKEYHVFDALDLPSEKGVRERLIKRAQDRVTAPEPFDRLTATAAHRLSMFVDPEFYFDYFTGLLQRTPQTRLVADMTPSYGMLSAQRFTQIRDTFAVRGVTTRPVFLMRDPVERIWSQIRMQARLYENTEAARTDSAEFLLTQISRPGYVSRTAYHQTIRALDEAFAPDEIFYGFYETLFSEAEVRRVCAHTGIDFVDPDFEERVHSSPKTSELPEDTVRTVAEHHREAYVAVAERFPDVSLLDLWPSSRFVL